MLPIPSNVVIIFFSEFIGCTLYLLFLTIIWLSKQAFLNTPFFKLFISTGFAGIGVIATNWLIQLTTYLPVQKESVMLIYVAQISNGSATFCYTLGKLLIVLNRVATLMKFEAVKTTWSPRTTFVLIFLQYIVPLAAHFYLAIAPVNWVDGAYKGLDSTTGSIYRSITGAFYALYAIIGVALNVVVVKRLRNLVKDSISSTTFYRQQRSLAMYTITSTLTHVLFALHQFAWTYSFIVADRDMLLSVRGMKPFVYGLTTFSDPLVLFLLSSQVRNALRQCVCGRRTGPANNNQMMAGFILNLFLLYLIRRFSTKELGTYKHLLEIFAAYDTYLVVIHHISNPKSIPSSTGYSFVCDRAFGTFLLSAFYSSVYSVPFFLLNVHLLYRYWTIRAPHRIALFSNAKFSTALVATAVAIHLAQFYASFIFARPEDAEEIRHYQQLFRQEYERDVNDGVFVMNYWREGHLSMRPFALLVIGDIMVLASLPLATALAVMTYREIHGARHLSETIRTFHLRVLIAASAQTITPVIFVYTPFVLNINISLFHIYSPTFSALGLVLLSCFPCLDAIVIIVLMKPYRKGLLQLLGRRKKESIIAVVPAFSTSVHSSTQ